MSIASSNYSLWRVDLRRNRLRRRQRDVLARVWRWTREKMQELHDKGRLVYTRSRIARNKRYLDEMPGTPITDVWPDIPPINSQAQERLGYPTQKPLALLERTISASSNEGALILDPFCGCGTTVNAAQKLSRRWIGIDITHLATHLIKRRLNEAFPKIPFDIVGEPKDLDGAHVLAVQDKYEFQKRALSIIGAQAALARHVGVQKGQAPDNGKAIRAGVVRGQPVPSRPAFEIGSLGIGPGLYTVGPHYASRFRWGFRRS